MQSWFVIRTEILLLATSYKIFWRTICYKKGITLNADVKRFWLGRLKSIHEDKCYNFVPLDVNFDGRYYANNNIFNLEFNEELEDYNPYNNEEE